MTIDPDEGTLRHQIKGSGKALFVATLTVILSVLTIAVFTAVLLVQSGNSADGLCRRAVAIREDSRSMWAWLIDQYPDDEVAIRGRAELDVRLARLRCEGSTLKLLEETP